MVVAALYDKPYARKVKKYSYCYVPVGAFRCRNPIGRLASILFRHIAIAP
jgi:hypothetical protein